MARKISLLNQKNRFDPKLGLYNIAKATHLPHDLHFDYKTIREMLTNKMDHQFLDSAK